ncbi:MAG: helix-turn-helix transcriptional regulator [Aristaeellaceae bacterium]
MQKSETSYFHSRVFIRLFLSYVLIIMVFLGVYAATYLVAYSSYHREMVEREMQQKADAWGMMLDQQLMTAQNVCAAVNTSENCRSILQTVYVEGRTIDSMQLYKMLNELKRIKGATSNINLYTLMLAFQNDNRLYTAGSVISVEGECSLLEERPYIGVTTVSRLLGVSNPGSMVMNKEYLVYADDYTAFNYTAYPDGTAAKGTVLVLLELSGLKAMAREVLADASGFCMLCGEDAFLTGGEETDYAFTAESMVSSRLRYRLYVPASAFAPPILRSVVIPVLGLALLGLLFIGVTYQLSKKYYQPIGSIGQMIERTGGNNNEIDDILEGIRGLIGERNGYRERMVTITPYARQGMLHSLLGGGVNQQELEVFTDKQFIGLSKACFMLALVNVAGSDVTVQQYQDAQALITHVCHEMSTDEHIVVCCPKNHQNLFVIVGSDDEKGMEDQFYLLYQRIVEALDDPRYAVTIGVSRLENDLEALQDACKDAERALEQMLTGGRSSVYFHESPEESGERRYFFPKDALKRMTRGLKEGDLASLQAMLDEIYRRNVQEADLPPSEIRLMVDELHVTIRSALRDVYGLSTTHIQMERIREAATIDEIFAYYRTVFATALKESRETEGGDERALEKEICAYIEENLCHPDLSLNSLADRFGVSTKMVSLICKNAYGKTFLQHVRDQQIHRAVLLLQTTDAPLEDIATRCGFTNLLTFRRNFKAVMGCNPSDMRK